MIYALTREIRITTSGCNIELCFAKIQCATGNQVHRTTDSIAIHVRCNCFAYFNRRENIRRNNIQCNGAITACFGRWQAFAIHHDGIENGCCTTNLNKTSFALISINRDTGNTLKRICHIRIGKATNQISRNDIADIVSIFLLIQRASLTFAHDTDNHIFKGVILQFQFDIVLHCLTYGNIDRDRVFGKTNSRYFQASRTGRNIRQTILTGTLRNRCAFYAGSKNNNTHTGQLPTRAKFKNSTRNRTRILSQDRRRRSIECKD